MRRPSVRPAEWLLPLRCQRGDALRPDERAAFSRLTRDQLLCEARGVADGAACLVLSHAHGGGLAAHSPTSCRQACREDSLDSIGWAASH